MYYFFVKRKKGPKPSAFVPWDMFMKSIICTLKEKNIDIEIISDSGKITKGDTVIFFIFDDVKSIENINAKFIGINTEGFFSKIIDPPHHVRIENKIKNIKTSQIWDYTWKNIESNLFKNHIYVPPGYSKIYEDEFEIEKDLDIVFYGSMNNRRSKILDKISRVIKPKKLSIIETTQHNHIKMIKRAKIVIDIHYYDDDKPIDYYRISPLLSNKVFVIHEDVQKEDKKSEAYKHLSKSIIFSSYDDFANVCKKWIDVSQEERDNVSEKTYKIFKNEFGLEKFIKV